MTTKTILKDLAGFPMVMAVSQKAINDQLAKVYGQSTNSPDMFPNVPWVLNGPEKGEWSLTVEQFAAPTVDFDTDVIMGCRLNMTILKGHYRTWVYKGMVDGKPNMGQVETPVDGLIMRLTTPMKQLVHDKWSDEMFEVQALFADLENMLRIELDLSENEQFSALGTVQLGLERILGDRIKDIGKKDPQALVFGAVGTTPIGHSEQTTGSLKPSAMAFSTTRIKHDSNYVTGDLNYLLSTAEQPKPTGGTVGVFRDGLLRPRSKATFVISEATVLEKIAKPLIERQFPNIDLGLTRGDYGAEVSTAKLYLNTEFPFGVIMNGHSRSASLLSIDSTIEDGKIKIQYRIKTSVYGAFKDIHIDVTAYRTVSIYLEGEKLKVKVSKAETIRYYESSSSPWDDFDGVASFALWKQDEDMLSPALSALNLPGNVVWKFISVTLDRHLYLTAAYE